MTTKLLLESLTPEQEAALIDAVRDRQLFFDFPFPDWATTTEKRNGVLARHLVRTIEQRNELEAALALALAASPFAPPRPDLEPGRYVVIPDPWNVDAPKIWDWDGTFWADENGHFVVQEQDGLSISTERDNGETFTPAFPLAVWRTVPAYPSPLVAGAAR